jgi:hypothetical protein
MGKRSKAKQTGSKNPGLRVSLRRTTSKTVNAEPDIDRTIYKDKPVQPPYSGNASAVPASSSKGPKVCCRR